MEMLRTLPGYDPDVAKNRAQARGIMEKLGYGPDNRLAVKVSARKIAPKMTFGRSCSTRALQSATNRG